MRLGVIGEPCIDYIYREVPGGAVRPAPAGRPAPPGRQETTKHFGGILYSVVSLAVITNKRDEIYPVMNLGEDEYDNITSFLSKFANIKMDFIYKSTHSTRIVKLCYRTGSSDAICQGSSITKTYDREESSTEPAPSISIEQINPAAARMDGILVNMVSGTDIDLKTLLSLREGYKGYIHMDSHNIVMRTGRDGTRSRGPVKDWLKWCTNCNTLQMNEAEISAISKERLDEYRTAEKILGSGKVKSVIITRGIRGVTMFEKKTKSSSGVSYSELDKIDLPSVETSRFADSTGCGDVFAAGFFYRNLENNLSDLKASLHYANRLAGRKSELIGVEELEKL